MNSIWLFEGFTTMLITGISGMPVDPLPSMLAQDDPPLVDLKMCEEPKLEQVAYKFCELLGSYASQEM